MNVKVAFELNYAQFQDEILHYAKRENGFATLLTAHYIKGDAMNLRLG